MDRWKNKIAVVTGASSGIGAACAMDLAKAGMIVIGLARREALVADLRDELPDEVGGRLHTLKCDITKESDVIKAFCRIRQKFGGVDVLINSAGVFRLTSLLAEDNTADLLATLNTNVLGMVYCTREAFKSMKERDVDGHVVNINSTYGHTTPWIKGFSSNMYAPSKHAVTALTAVYRQEFHDNNTKIKVTSVSPGPVDTNLVPKRAVEGMALLKAADVSAAVVFAIQTPHCVQITELTITPMGKRF